MAGPVRQPIDQASLERYLEQNVPEVKPPLELKQVRQCPVLERVPLTTRSVWFRSIESNIPDHRLDRTTLCLAKETSGRAAFEDSAQG
jgi:hypothetical protein